MSAPVIVLACPYCARLLKAQAVVIEGDSVHCCECGNTFTHGKWPKSTPPKPLSILERIKRWRLQ